MTRVTFALSEGWRNVRAGGVAGLLLLVVLVTSFTLAATVDALRVEGLSQDQRSWVAAGGLVLIAENDEGMSGADCERLNTAAGVYAAAGFLRTGYRAALSNAPDAGLPITGATPGLSRLLKTSLDPTRLVVTEETAESYGLAEGAWLALTPQSTTGQGAQDSRSLPTPELDRAPHQVSVLTSKILGEDLRATILALAPVSTPITVCYVWTAPGATETLRAALGAQLPGLGEKPTTVADRLDRSQFGRDFAAEYETRPLRWAPAGVGLLVGLTWTLMRWGRRSSDGLYATLGFGRRDLFVLRMTEWFVALGAGLAVTMALSLIVLAVNHAMTSTALSHMVRAAIMAGLASTLIAVCATRLPIRSPLTALKDAS